MHECYWLVTFWKNGFEGKMLVVGTEEDMWAYLYPGTGRKNDCHVGYFSYKRATEAEIEAAKLLQMKIHVCPKTHH